MTQELDFVVGIARETVDGNDNRHMELADVLNVLLQVDTASLEGVEVFCVQFLLRHAAVVLERANGRNNNSAVRLEASLAALDVKELLSTEVSTETGLCNGIIRKLECQTGGNDGVAAVCDVGERAAVHQTGRTVQCLYQIRFDGVLEQSAHRAVHLEIAGKDRRTVVTVCDQNVTAALFQVG